MRTEEVVNRSVRSSAIAARSLVNAAFANFHVDDVPRGLEKMINNYIADLKRNAQDELAYKMTSKVAPKSEF